MAAGAPAFFSAPAKAAEHDRGVRVERETQSPDLLPAYKTACTESGASASGENHDNTRDAVPVSRQQLNGDPNVSQKLSPKPDR